MTVTCITSQLDLRAGTRGEDTCSCSGSAKLAKAIINNEKGVENADTKEELKDLCIYNCTNVHPQARKHKDSYKLLIGKCPDCHHRNVSWDAKNKFAIATRILVVAERSLDTTDQKENGNATNKNKKAIYPNKRTGSSR